MFISVQEEGEKNKNRVENAISRPSIYTPGYMHKPFG